MWSVDVERVATRLIEDAGVGALVELLARMERAVGKVAALPPDCDVRIWWSADSDSDQGGFVLPIEVVTRIAALGVDVFATVYLGERV